MFKGCIFIIDLKKKEIYIYIFILYIFSLFFFFISETNFLINKIKNKRRDRNIL